MNNGEIRERLVQLRKDMAEMSVDICLITSSDYHSSEYVGDYFKTSVFFSGCTSDNVILLVTAERALLWTDGRYFISAAAELEGTGISLMKSGETGVPTVFAWLKEELREGTVLGFDGRCVTALDGRKYREIAAEKGAVVSGDYTPADRIWQERPAMASHPVMLLPEEVTGESYAARSARVLEALRRKGAGTLVISRLDDIMWLLNIRGADIACNPVALSYLVFGGPETVLFLQESECTDEFLEYAAANKIRIRPYADFFSYLDEADFCDGVLADESSASDAIMRKLLAREADGVRLVRKESPVPAMKAVKNDTERKHLRKAYIADSVAVCRFIFRIKSDIGKREMTEVTAAEEMDALRREIPGFLDLSFETISAYRANAAMAHYAPSAENCARLAPEGFLLVDSGGQYRNGTTDVTRTIALGPLSDRMKEDFTLVAVANLRLLYAKFPYGCSGVNLDTYARAPFWEKGMNFNHGTGHGIGYILNVHEGPQNIRWKARDLSDLTAFEPGMITSDEPGIYIEGQYGIRTETIMECVEAETTGYGRFLRFEPLTFAPIDLDAIDTGCMDASDIRRLNRYHRQVWEKISPYLEGEEKEWLRHATREV
jgi:Xaa-Pro aminopeptidase